MGIETAADIRRHLKDEGYVFLPGAIALEPLKRIHQKAIEIGQEMGFLKTSSTDHPILLAKRKPITFQDQFGFAHRIIRTKEYSEVEGVTRLGLNLDSILKRWRFFHPEVKDDGLWSRFVGPRSHNSTLPSHQDANYQGAHKKNLRTLVSINRLPTRSWQSRPYCRDHTSTDCNGTEMDF